MEYDLYWKPPDRRSLPGYKIKNIPILRGIWKNMENSNVALSES